VGADGLTVVEGAEDEDAAQVGPRQRRHEGAGAGRQHEHVVGLGHLAAAGDDAPPAVDPLGRDAAVDEDAVLVVPVGRVEPELA
jgi:hypothetical protein